MKLQFSLATLLVCMTVLAVVCAAAVTIPVHEPRPVKVPRTITDSQGYLRFIFETHIIEWRIVTAADVVRRFFVWGPASIAATLATLWAISRLKSRRHTEPPIG